jgi:Tol biopolymer transport system component
MKHQSALLFIVTVFVLAILFVGCSPSEDEGKATSTQFARNSFATQTANVTPPSVTPTLTPTPTQEPTIISPEAILDRALKSVDTEQSYHYHSEKEIVWHGVMDEVILVTDGDFKAPDRAEETISLRINENEVDLEFITIGDVFYLKDPETGQWEIDFMLRYLTLSAFTRTRPGIPPIEFTDIRDLVLVEETSLDGVKVYHFKGTGPISGIDDALDSSMQIDYWVGVDDGMLKQSAADGEMTITSDEISELFGFDSVKVDISWTQRISDFGKAVAIEAPQVVPWVEGRLILSNDHRRNAYSRLDGGKYILVIDQIEYGPFDSIGEDVVYFSPDGQHVAYFIYEGDELFLLIDHKVVGGPYQGYGGFTFSPDSQHYAYRAMENGKDVIVLDGVNQKYYDQVDNPHFSPDSQRLLYSARLGDEWFTVLDGIEGKRYEDLKIQSPGFSPDSNRYTALAKKDGKFRILVDGVEGNPYTSYGAFPSFSPDSRHVVYSAWNDEGWFVVLGNQKYGPYLDLAEGRPTFSPDGMHMAYVAWERDGVYFFIDGEKEGPYDSVAGENVFSPDGQRIAYAARLGEEWFMVIDGQRRGPFMNVTEPEFSKDSQSLGYVGVSMRGVYAFINEDEFGPYEKISKVIFSPDSKRFAFLAMKDGQSYIVLDGVELGPYELAGFPIFSPDSQRLAYAVREGEERFIMVDDRKSRSYDRILDFDNHSGMGIIFDDDDLIRYLVLIEGDIHIVEETID